MTILRYLLSAIMLTVSVAVTAQKKDYQPLTSWPYLYEDFQQGCITTFQGAEVWYDKLNLNLLNGRAHFVKDGTILEAESSKVASLAIGDEVYVSVSGSLAKVLKKTEHSYVVCSVKIDADAMNKSDIGYGKSSLASTQNVSLNAITNNMEVAVNKSLETITKEKDSGDPLILKKVNGIIFKGLFIPALRSEVLNINGIDKEAVKKFIKDRKIKFNQTDDLAVLVEYLYSL